MSVSDVGDQRRVIFDFRDAATGAPVDPATVTVTVTDPLGGTSAPPVVNDPAAVGRFYVTFDVTLGGTWRVRASTTSPKCAETHVFAARHP